MKKIFVIGWTLIPAFTFSACSGIALLGIEGANSAIGLWHYRIGIIASVISTGHMLKRLPLLRK